MTNGSVEPLKKLHAIWGREVQFLEVIVRQAHPGPGVPPYRGISQKMHDANRYQAQERIPWPVLVDGINGSVHQTYGSLSDPIYILDADLKVAYYNMWAHAPTLHDALTELKAQGWRGVVLDGVDQRPHLLHVIADGWRGIRRGLPQSALDLEMIVPTSSLMLWLGSKLKPVLAPVALRATPLPKAARMGLAVGAALAAAGALRLALGSRTKALAPS